MASSDIYKGFENIEENLGMLKDMKQTHQQICNHKVGPNMAQKESYNCQETTFHVSPDRLVLKDPSSPYKDHQTHSW